MKRVVASRLSQTDDGQPHKMCIFCLYSSIFSSPIVPKIKENVHFFGKFVDKNSINMQIWQYEIYDFSIVLEQFLNEIESY